MDTLKDAIMKFSTQLEELNLNVLEIKESIARQRGEELLKRIETLEASLKESHLKLDTLNAIDITPAEPRVTREPEAKAEIPDAVETPAEGKKFSNITEFFKFLWVGHRDLVYEKNVYSEAEYLKLYEEGKAKFTKKKNELTMQNSIAFAIWRVISTERKEIVKAMKSQNAIELQKNNSREVHEESEE